MIPFTFPSSPSLVTGNAECKIFYLSSVVGMRAWTDYIPVRSYTSSSPVEGTTDAAGYQAVKPLSSTTGLAAWTDYIPVYEDASLTKPWSTDAGGYIPVGAAGSRLSLNFAGTTAIDSRITFTRASSGTFFGSDGRLATASNNVARLDYDPATPIGVTGGELVTNGDFSNGTTGWTIGGGSAPYNVTSANGTLDFAGSASFVNVAQTVLTIGKTYQITYTLVNRSAGSIRVSASGSPGTLRSAPGTYTETLTAGANGQFILQDTLGTFVGSIDNISVKEVTFAPRGLLIEEQRTNSLLHSRDMTQAAWTKASATVAKDAVGLDGTANSASTVTASATTHACVQTLACTASTAYTFTFYVKRGTMTDLKYCVRDVTGAADIIAATSYYSQTNATGFSRITVAFTTPVGCVSLNVYLLRDSGVTGTAIFDCAQLEVGSFATSPIITGAATATRSADSASMTGTNFSSWYNQTQGTFVAEWSKSDGNTATGIAYSAYQDASNHITQYGCIATNQGRQIVTVAAVASAQFNLLPINAATPNKAALAYAANSFAGSLNGGTPSTDVSGTLPTPTTFYIGSTVGGQYLNGHIRRLQFYPVALPSAIQSLTA